MTNKERYEEAKQMYAGFGVDTDKALETLKNIPISMHCWQGDDVTGFDRLPEGFRRRGIIREKPAHRKS